MRSFSAILRKYSTAMIMNFVGLVLAFTAFMALMIQVDYQQNFDKSYSTAGRIFRVDKKGISKDDIFRNILPRGYVDDIISSSPHIVAGTIACPFIGERIFHSIGDGTEEPFAFKSKADVVYPDFLKVFGAEIVEGNADALADLTQIAIPQSLAGKLYGDEPAIGKIIRHNEEFKFGFGRAKEMTVGAVYKDFPKNSQVENIIYLNIGNLQEGSYGGANYVCWLLLDSTDSKELVENNFNEKFNYKDTEWLTDIELTPIERIYFEDCQDTIYKRGSKKQMWLLIWISILVMVIGCINYATFFTALAPMRVKSINTMKVLGSSTARLRAELILEAVIFSIFALVIALLIITPVSEYLVSSGISDIAFQCDEQISLIALTTMVSVITGLAGGIYPSFYVTSLPPAFALKGNFAFSGSGRRFRTTMLGLQYAITFTLLIFVMSAYRQNKFMTEYDTGFEKDKIAVVELSQAQAMNKSEWLAERLKSLPEVNDVTFSMECIGGNDTYSTATLDFGQNSIRCFTFYCAPNFLDVMDIPVIEGRNFSPSDQNGAYSIINQTMKEQGGRMCSNDEVGEIIGVTGPVRINSLRSESAPVCYQVLPKGYVTLSYAYIKLQDGFVRKDVCAKINGILEELEPNYPFEIKFYDMIMDKLYEQEIRQNKIISLFSILAALLSLTGVFGQVLLDVQFRKRDVAIRKVYGADRYALIKDGAKRYSIIVGSAFIIAAPVAWYAASRWLENFAETPGLSIWLFAGALALVLTQTLCIVIYQYWNAIAANPIDSLRKE